MIRKFKFFLTLFISLVGLKAFPDTWNAKYCVPSKNVDLNPFREITDGKDLAYLLLLRSYISTDPTEPGILSGFEFSPDGTVFTGRINPAMRWKDGTILSANEAALGIARGLHFRALGQRVQVINPDEIATQDWEKKKYVGIEIIDPLTFKLKFISKIKNLTGVIREALSTNSRHNRLWPVKLNPLNTKSPQVLAKFDQILTNEGLGLTINGKKVLVTSATKCDDPDFSISSDIIDLKSNAFATRKSPISSAVTIQTNTAKLSKLGRMELINFIRAAFSRQPPSSGISPVSSFFEMGENGFDDALNWPNSTSIKNSNNRKFKIAYELPIFKEILEAAFKNAKLSVELIELPTSELNFDAQVLSSGIQGGRHLILQDILQWPHVQEFMVYAPKTFLSLREIAQRSASTIPLDVKTLQNFEKCALEEQSVAPIARRNPLSFSKSNLPFCLDWTNKGELTFLPKTKCNN